jgi:hypothetical protein
MTSVKDWRKGLAMDGAVVRHALARGPWVRVQP